MANFNTKQLAEIGMRAGQKRVKDGVLSGTLAVKKVTTKTSGRKASSGCGYTSPTVLLDPYGQYMTQELMMYKYGESPLDMLGEFGRCTFDREILGAGSLFSPNPLSMLALRALSQRSHDGVVYCPHCGKRRASSSHTFCGYCRQEFYPHPARPTGGWFGQSPAYCPSCGGFVGSHAQSFCVHCSHDLRPHFGASGGTYSHYQQPQMLAPSAPPPQYPSNDQGEIEPVSGPIMAPTREFLDDLARRCGVQFHWVLALALLINHFKANMNNVGQFLDSYNGTPQYAAYSQAIGSESLVDYMIIKQHDPTLVAQILDELHENERYASVCQVYRMMFGRRKQ